MSFIIFDLEWVATVFKGQIPEIISIGAVKLESKRGNVVEVDQFQAYVRPVKAKRLNKRTTKITGIRPQDVRSQDDFKKTWRRFVNWLGDREYYLLTWGTEDVRTLIHNCRQHRISLEWLRNYTDLQAEFGRLYHQRNQTSLPNALELLKITPVGQHHSAIDDARNTAEIFKVCFSRLRLQNNNHNQILKRYGPKHIRRVAKPHPGFGSRSTAPTQQQAQRREQKGRKVSKSTVTRR
jgi:inhibitor of KinA sporulation pathway (predicted exonuclease)